MAEPVPPWVQRWQQAQDDELLYDEHMGESLREMPWDEQEGLETLAQLSSYTEREGDTACS